MSHLQDQLAQTLGFVYLVVSRLATGLFSASPGSASKVDSRAHIVCDNCTKGDWDWILSFTTLGVAMTGLLVSGAALWVALDKRRREQAERDARAVFVFEATPSGDGLLDSELDVWIKIMNTGDREARSTDIAIVVPKDESDKPPQWIEPESPTHQQRVLWYDDDTAFYRLSLVLPEVRNKVPTTVRARLWPSIPDGDGTMTVRLGVIATADELPDELRPTREDFEFEVDYESRVRV